MSDFLINNKPGILKNEQSVFELLKYRVEKSLKENVSISFYILTNFSFFESFKRISSSFSLLEEKKLLNVLNIVFVSKNKLNIKEVYKDFKKDAISLDADSYAVLDKLYKKKIFSCSIFTERAVDTNILIIKSRDAFETWVGSASFSSDSQSDKIEFMSLVDSNSKSAFHFDIFSYIYERSAKKLYDKELIDILKRSAYMDSLFLNQKDFVSTMLKIMNKDFLVKNLGADLSLFSEMQNMSYYHCLDILKGYGLAFLFNTAGLGKTDISSSIAKYYKENDKKVLVIHSPLDLMKWTHSMRKSGLKTVDITYVSRLELTKRDFNCNDYKDYDLIIISESELFRNIEIESLMNLNLKKIIENNISSDYLLMIDYFTVSSLFDYPKIVNVFNKVCTHPKFITNGITQRMKLLEENIKNNLITKDSIEDIFFVVNNLSINIKQTDFNTYFKNNLIVNPEKPTITQVKYAYTHEIYVKIYDKLTNFLHDLNLEYMKLWNTKIENIDLNYYRWKIYMKLESSIYTFRVCLKNILEKSVLLRKILTDNTCADNTLFTREQQENMINNFGKLEDSAREIIMGNIIKDIKNVENMITNIEQIKYLENHDDKITSLLKILKTENKPTLIFSESKDTVLYIERRLKEYGNFKTVLCYGDEQSFEEIDLNDSSDTDRNYILNAFNSGEFDILISTDILDENYIFNRAEIIVNFDLCYNTSILYQRINKMGKNLNSKKTKIFNFQPDRRIDKEILLFETLQMDNRDVFAIIGFDFFSWIVNDKKVNDVSNKNLQNILYLTRDYKDFVSMKNPEELQQKFYLKTLESNIILREYIKYFNISEDTLKFASLNYSKPIFTTFRGEDNFYFIFFKYDEEIYCINDIYFSDDVVENELGEEELNSIREKVDLRIKEINLSLGRTPSEFDKSVTIGIIKYFKE